MPSLADAVLQCLVWPQRGSPKRAACWGWASLPWRVPDSLEPLPDGEELDLVRVRAHKDGATVAEVPTLIRRGHSTTVFLTPISSN